MKRALVLALFFAFAAMPASANPRQHKAHTTRFVPLDANGNVVTVSTAAGINIRVAPSFAAPIKGFIADLVARGYRPRHIGCYSWARSHVRHSLHHTGEACDFDQRGWGKTARPMYHVHALALKWGLRDGCSFKDCGHIDAGRQTDLAARRHRKH